MADDTGICPSLGLTDAEERKRKEEERVLRNMMARTNPKVDKTVLKKQLAGEMVMSVDDRFRIYLENMPAEPNKPLIVHFNDKQVYHSGQSRGPINTHFAAHMVGDGRTTQRLRLQIGVKAFDNVLDLDATEGCNLKLAFTERGLLTKQQVQAFDK